MSGERGPTTEAALRELVAVVNDAAWNGYAWIGLAPCVSCGSECPRHDPDCELQAALDAAEAALDERGADRIASAPVTQQSASYT